MNESPQDYLISTPSGDLHDLQITWSNNRSLIYLSTNHRTIGLSPEMAHQLSNGLLAVLRGGFSRAVTEIVLLREQQEFARRAARIPSAPTPAPTNPELDLL
jgi:hypothetical protein